MSTAANPKFKISATYLGPIFSFDADLTKQAQNLIFARNGTGKSFLSRAFRYLDLHGQGDDISDAAKSLVSDESIEGKGTFSFSRGTDCKGSLSLNTGTDEAAATLGDTIFHVFSEDFVQTELRERQFEIDGKVENQISVDSENIKLKDAQEAVQSALDEETKALNALKTKYETRRVSQLHEKAGINKQLKDYKDLSLEGVLQNNSDKPDQPEKSFTDILKDLDGLKAIPAEPKYPEQVEPLNSSDVDTDALQTLLIKETSPSSVSADIKNRIDEHHDFFETGVEIIKSGHQENCPFCQQSLQAPSPSAVIEAYVSYFEDEEEKHKAELRTFFKRLSQKETELNNIERLLAVQKTDFDDLKAHVPSQKNNILNDYVNHLKHTRDTITAIKATITSKAEKLGTAHELPEESIADSLAKINKTVEANNKLISTLNKAVEKSDDERKSLQRIACQVFDQEFAIENWTEFEATKRLAIATTQRKQELANLEKSSPSTDARTRLADTFELLLKEFFADKYLFDKEAFSLKRGEKNMDRGPHRTLSDGEKTAIAFCYFIACVHRKVKSDSDYRTLYLVFDDPVTSMSYDYIFAIAQTLKNLSISNKGEVSINSGKIDGNKFKRPELLILTHSSYFFNISKTNRVVKPEATFSLANSGTQHVLSHLDDYVAPFERQLEHVFKVSEGSDPDFSTANAIRSVLEAVGRFCRPDKSDSLENFIKYVAADEGISIKSVLVNSLCHGTYYDESPTPEDMSLACKEAILVVERFAVGHLEILKKQS